MEKRYDKVIVLGAGASAAYSESPTGQRPPLAREIISTFNRLDISGNRHVLVGDILNYVRDTRGIEPLEFTAYNEDVELLLTELDEKIALLSSDIRRVQEDGAVFMEFVQATRAYNQLIFLFTAIFNEIQNGPISIPHAMLASELGAGDAIITFNWDTLMDRALTAAHKWTPDFGYAIKPEYIFDDDWKRPVDTSPEPSGPRYLKLHGSTNWLTPYHFVDMQGEFHTLSGYSMDKLYVFVQATKEYVTYMNRYWGEYAPYSYCYYPPNLPVRRDDTKKGHINVTMVSAIDLPDHGKTIIDDQNVYSMPLIVPPVRNKQYSRYGSIFSTLWAQAEKTITRCRTLYIIGYSFPVTDMASKELFRKALADNKELERVVIVNPYPEKIRDLFITDFNLPADKLEVKAKRFEVPVTGRTSILG